MTNCSSMTTYASSLTLTWREPSTSRAVPFSLHRRWHRLTQQLPLKNRNDQVALLHDALVSSSLRYTTHLLLLPFLPTLSDNNKTLAAYTLITVWEPRWTDFYLIASLSAMTAAAQHPHLSRACEAAFFAPNSRKKKCPQNSGTEIIDSNPVSLKCSQMRSEV